MQEARIGTSSSAGAAGAGVDLARMDKTEDN